MKNKMLFVSLFVLLATIFASTIADAQGPKPTPPKAPGSVKSPNASAGTAFTYQGQLKSGGNAVNSSCDFQFGLYDALTGGAQIGTTQTQTNVTVSNGLFTTQIDFGAGTITGNARWLNIAVRCPAGNGSFTTLAPRQALTPAPMALALPGLYTQQNATSPNVVGGYSGNVISDTVVGGTISGGGLFGSENKVLKNHATVGGGNGNTASNWNATVSGGGINTASGNSAAVGGGWRNTASGNNAVVGGGSDNTASNLYATVGGGSDNTASNLYATVGGGTSNIASGGYAIVGGGHSNTAEADYDTVGGGYNNHALGSSSVVGGGKNNLAEKNYDTVGGGFNNYAAGSSSVVSGGWLNTASGLGATIPGGANNFAGGLYSFAAGNRARANHPGTFVWADSNNNQSNGLELNSTGTDQFLIRANGGIGVGTNAPAAQLHVSSGGASANPQMRINQTNTTDYARLRISVANANYWDIATGPSTNNAMNFFRNGTGDVMSLKPDDATNYLVMGNGARLTKGGAWTNASDRNLKTNFETVDSRAVLAQVVNLPITAWNYKAEDARVRHLGPMAQDFYAAFKLGDDDKTISTIDLDGVALSSIQGLYELAKEKDAHIASQQKQIESLETRLATLEQIARANNGNGQMDNTTNIAMAVVGVLVGIIITKSWQRGQK